MKIEPDWSGAIYRCEHPKSPKKIIAFFLKLDLSQMVPEFKTCSQQIPKKSWLKLLVGRWEVGDHSAKLTIKPSGNGILP